MQSQAQINSIIFSHLKGLHNFSTCKQLAKYQSDSCFLICRYIINNLHLWNLHKSKIAAEAYKHQLP